MKTGKFNCHKVLTIALLIITYLLSSCASNEDEEFKKEMLKYSSKEIYELGKKELADDSYKKAIKYFEALEQIYPYGSESKVAMLDLAYAYYKDDQNDIATAELDSFIHTYPTDPHVAYALYLKGTIYYNILNSPILRFTGQNVSERDVNNIMNSYQAFHEITEKHPKSQYYNDSVRKVKLLINHLAESELYKARYYMSVKAYLAAIQHSQNVVTTYSHTKYVEEALAIIVYAYHAINEDKLSEKTQLVLNTNFKNSRYVNEYWSPHDMPWYSFVEE